MKNSGTIFGSYKLVSKCEDHSYCDTAEIKRLVKDDTLTMAVGCKASAEKKRSIFNFLTEFTEDSETVTNPPVKSTIVVERYFLEESPSQYN